MLQSKHNTHGTFLLSHVRPSSMKRVAYEVALKEKKRLAEGTVAFVFERPNGFHFQAGQHIRMTLLNPAETDSEGTSRFFSLANSPHEQDLVIAMRMRDTAFKRVLGRLPIGAKVRIEILLKSPHGSFTLHDDSLQPAVFLIGGIGIVPALSMIKDATERKLPHKMFLFYSNRRPEDAPFLDELETLAKQNPSFTLIATMTRPEKSAESWRGEIGFITHSMLKKYVDDLQSPIYYLAGLPELVSAMKTMLIASGVSEENLRAEEFTGFNLNEIHNMNNHAWKRYGPLVAIALLIIVVVTLHIGAAISLFKSGLGESFLANPIFYVMIGLMLLIAPFKFKHILGFMHRKKKQPAREMPKV